MTNMAAFSIEFRRLTQCQVRMGKSPNIHPSISPAWGFVSRPSLFRHLWKRGGGFNHL